MGKSVSNIRKVGQVPVNIFGQKMSSISASAGKSDLDRFLKSEGDSGLVYLILGDEKKEEIPTLIDEIQRKPVNEEVLHISFKRVDLKEKVQQEVAVEMIGEVNIPGATVLLTRDVLEVEALPAELPEKIIFDISGLTAVGQSLHLVDAQFDREKVKILLSEEELASPFVIVQEVKEEVVEEVLVEAAVEGATPGEATAEAPVEGVAEAKPKAE
jgi:large subunit ribosomal protein L25